MPLVSVSRFSLENTVERSYFHRISSFSITSLATQRDGHSGKTTTLSFSITSL